MKTPETEHLVEGTPDLQILAIGEPLRTVASERDFFLFGDNDLQELIKVIRSRIAEGDALARTTNVAVLRDRYVNALGLLAAIVEKLDEGDRS